MTTVLARAPAPPAPRHAPRAGHREALVARVALGVIALAVLDDAFVHREPGISVADHVASGLLPAVLALALRWCIPAAGPGSVR